MRLSRRKGVCTTRRGQHESDVADLVNRNFTVFAPLQLWVADINYVSTWAGFLYFSVVLDASSRRIVGWAMDTRLHTQLVLDALDMALWKRRLKGLIHHSDQGSQYTSLAFGLRCKKGRCPSRGPVGDCFANAMYESIFPTVECELLDRHCFRTFQDTQRALFEYIEGWFNPHRRHSALGYHSPTTNESNQQSWA